MREPIVSNVTARPQVVRHRPRNGTLIWALNRASAYALILFLGVHLYYNYFAAARAGVPITFEIVNQRFALDPLLYTINAFGLLVTALFHGLSGLRSVLFDVVTNSVVRRIVTILLAVVGLWALIDGSLSLLALLRGA
jgi:succinate dehydrogenase / fumarate reductase, membrane anchor subunit